MRTVCFAGPSTVGLELPQHWQLCPPIRHGDLDALWQQAAEPARLVIIDGEFGQALPITVTEIREALLRGNEVLGCSSMGALRAAECEVLGMAGSGWIFQRYQDGTLIADDEVALLYDPESFTNFTVPSANLRWLLAELVADGRLTAEDAAEVIRVGRAVPFRDRTLRQLTGAVAGLLPDRPAVAVVLQALADRPSEAWNRKRLDAAELIAALDG